MTEMNKPKRVIKYMIAGIAILLIGIQEIKAWAAEGTVTFGSESYGWYTGDTCPIGVYVGCDMPIGSYEVCLQYDETMLRYVEGAVQQDGSFLYLRGTGTETTYKTMLYFEPLQPGTTTLQVISAAGMTVTDTSGNEFQEEIEVSVLPGAPIAIGEKISDRLAVLSTEPVDIEGFSPEIYEYYLTVENEVENLTLSFEAEDEDAAVNVSDTTLLVGDNTVTVSVKGTDAQARVYTIHVTREEVIEEEPQVSPPQISEKPQVSEASDVSQNTGVLAVSENTVSGNEEVQKLFRHNPLLWCAAAGVFVLLGFYLMLYIKKQKKEVQEAEWNEDALEIINLEQTVIDIKNVTMRFKLAQDEASSLKEYLIRVIKRENHYNYLTALDNISFEVKQGDVIGIIGTNGSGKSTLLKIISGALYPSAGHVEVDRSKVQMLTLGTGFDMELTAKENVYLNGAIIGYSKEYIDEKYEDIVRFAELEGFMEERMKNFSSGMVSRLGFAIATMRDAPEILILDEVLSVGDLFFRQKSEKRIREMIHSGATVLIVSHSLDTIRKNCNRVVWIEKGVMKMEGSPETVCAAYRDFAE